MSDEHALRNIARNMVRLRGQRSQYWLAKACETYPANIARIENEESMPGGGLLSRIAEALGASMNDLVEDPPKNSRKTG